MCTHYFLSCHYGSWWGSSPASLYPLQMLEGCYGVSMQSLNCFHESLVTIPVVPVVPQCPPATHTYLHLFFYYIEVAAGSILPHINVSLVIIVPTCTTAGTVKPQMIKAQTRNIPQRPILWLPNPGLKRDACAKLIWLISGHGLEALLDIHLLLFARSPV